MSRDLVALMHRLGPEFAARARRSDDEDLFVAENYVALKKHGVLRAGLPVELGGASSTLASRIGAAGYKLMRLSHAPWTS
jgi:alkylation response protein AidB-like acyl-CoA dehydrogenase